MSKNRLEAFSDGLIAIIITVMVLDLKAPVDATLRALVGLRTMFSCYVLSFLYLGIYWTNHHHLLQAAEWVRGSVLWANLHLLFWLSLIPFATMWMSRTHFATWPVVLYGLVLLLSACAYYVLAVLLRRMHGQSSLLARAIGHDLKGKVSIVLYVAALGLAFVATDLALALYVTVAIMWLIPDRRIERLMPAKPSEGSRT